MGDLRAVYSVGSKGKGDVGGHQGWCGWWAGLVYSRKSTSLKPGSQQRMSEVDKMQKSSVGVLVNDREISSRNKQKRANAIS